MIAQNGGGAFLILFLLFSLIVSVPLFLFEMALGKHARCDIAAGFAQNAARYPKIARAGGLCMFSGLFVLSFYLVILSWVLAFIPHSFMLQNANEAASYFRALSSDDLPAALGYFAVCFALVLRTIYRGIIAGIERLNVILMPLLFALLLALLVYAAFCGDFGVAFVRTFAIDFSALSVENVLNALGLALFMMCLGIGCIYTFSASAQSDTSVLKSALFVVFINLFTGILMALVVFSFTSDDGVGMVFVSLVASLAQLGTLGHFLCAIFFVALFFAGLTSAISMIEPLVFYLTRRLNSRTKAVFVAFCAVLIIGIICILGMQGVLAFDGFGVLDFLTSNILLPAGVLFLALYAGFLMRFFTLARLFLPMFSRRVFVVYYFFIRFIAPLVILLVAFRSIYEAIS